MVQNYSCGTKFWIFVQLDGSHMYIWTFLLCGAVHLDRSKIMYMHRQNGRQISVNLDQHPIGQSKAEVVGRNLGLSKNVVVGCKVTVHNCNFGRSKFTVHNRNFEQSNIQSTVVILDGPNLLPITLQMDGQKLRLTGGLLDHRPFGQLRLVNLDGSNYAIWTKDPSSS